MAFPRRIRRALVLAALGGLVVPALVSPGRAGAATGTTSHNPMLNTGLEEPDERYESEPPTLSALCQSQIGQLNTYANPAPNVDMITGDAVVQAGTQTGCSTAQNETAIAVNPQNPRNLVAGTNDYRVFNTRENRNDGSGWAYTTFDGGRTWADTVLPHLTFQTGATGQLVQMDSAGDPAVAYGTHNDVYYANIVFSRLNAANGITVSASHDGGRTWGEPSIVQIDGVDAAGNAVDTPFFNDKEWITVDPDSGTVYVSWTRFDDVSSPIVVASSRDGGRTWSPFRYVTPTAATFRTGLTPYAQGSNPVVGHDGTLYVAYESAVCVTLACDQPGDHDATIVARSTDRGRTFVNTEVGVNYDFPFDPDTGRSGLSGENFRVNSFPQLTIDRHTDTLYVTWADDRNGAYTAAGQSIRTNGDVVVARSSNGRNWNTSVLGTAADEVYPAIAATDGVIAVTTYTRAYDAAGTGLDYAYWSGRNLNQLGRSNPHRITTQTSDPAVQFVGVGAVSGKELQGLFIGDYSAVALGDDGVLHPCWTDFRGRPGTTSPNQDAYTASIRLND